MKMEFVRQMLAGAMVAAAVGVLGMGAVQDQHANGESEEAEAKMAPNDHFYDARSWPEMRFDLKAYSAALQQVSDISTAKVTGNPITDGAWRLEGPNNLGGRLNAIATDPNDPNTILVGCASGGVFKTTDAGATWFPIFDDRSYLAIGDITFQPGSSSVIYVGTGDLNVTGFPAIGDGLYKSTDGGSTWAHLGLTDTRVISRVVVDPSNANHIIVGAMGLPMERDNNRGIYVTVNGGLTWTQSLFISNETGVIDMWMAPNNPQVLYASSWDRIRTNQESVIAGNNAKVWKSVDGGLSWNALTAFPSTYSSRINLAVHPTNGSIVYAAVVDTTLEIGAIYKTINGGSTWTSIDVSGVAGAMSGFGWYFGNIFLNPYNPSDLYLCGVQLWRTGDEGNTWHRMDPDWWAYDVHADKHDIAFLGANSLLLATDGGLYRTNDGGTSWTDVDDIPNSQAYRVAVNPHNPGIYAAGFQDNGTSDGNYQNLTGWSRIYGGDGFQPLYDSDPNHMVAEYQYGGLMFTEDGGNTWNDFTVNIDPDDRRNWDMPVIQSSHADYIYYTGTYRVYRNTDGLLFQNWYAASPDLTDGIIFGPRYHTITTIAESPVNDQVVYAGTSDGNVHVSTNAGSTWTNISAGLPDRYVTSIKASPFAADEVLVTVSGYKSNDYVPHILRSTNRGGTWADVSGDLPQLALNDVLLHPTADSVWVVGSDGGVYATQNRGQNWLRVGQGMPVMPVYDMDWDLVGRRLVAGTFARSVMSFPSDSLVMEVILDRPEGTPEPRVALFPNPAHDVVHLQTPQGIESWSLWNAGGQQIAQGNRLQAGDAIDVSGLPRGSYLLRLNTQGIAVTRKLLLH